MTASEFAFLAVGLVLGVASGSALVMVLGSRPPAREVRLTVEHAAVPRRAATLAGDAFTMHSGEVARGGPADRRRLDRDAPPEDPRPYVPVMAPIAAAARADSGPGSRTPVLSDRSGPGPRPSPGGSDAPDRDPAVDALRVQAALAAERLYRAGFPSAATMLDARAQAVAPGADRNAATGPFSGTAPVARAPVATAPVATAVRTGSVTQTAAPALPGVPEALPTDPTPGIVRILRGDHRALLAVVAELAGEDTAERRPWQAALMGLADVLVDRASAAGWLDFPVGNPFWDTFTTQQCRDIAEALALAGYRLDRAGGWADGHRPGYRDLAAAVAAIGIEPRRIRAWPTQEEIDHLVDTVTIAADEFVSEHAPDLDLEAMRALVARGLTSTAMPRAQRPGGGESRLWSDWSRVREVLLRPVAA